MIVFPHAKINLGLNVVRKRADGFHDIQSVLVPIPLCDVLEVVVDPVLAPGEVVFNRSGLSIAGAIEEDLCMKALRLVEQQRPLPGLRMHLHKVVPSGAGLGGGSSDGAHVLRLLNDLLQLGLKKEELFQMAASLGSDCPFFLHHGAQLAEGRGERLSPITVDLKNWWLVLVNPGVHVSTAEVYRNTTPTGTEIDLAAVLSHPPNRWNGALVNTMEPYVLSAYPAVAHVKKQLLDFGAAYAAMSGSGSCVFGLFRERPEGITWPKSHRQWVFHLDH